ncbi:hypothetical protein NIES4073_06650 [Kalymmatonema gypsitolerans NIES-4073]|nr:hypothetical protein NIES4073_06650 [Scytonema sp. NIES-4073]
MVGLLGFVALTQPTRSALGVPIGGAIALSINPSIAGIRLNPHRLSLCQVKLEDQNFR